MYKPCLVFAAALVMIFQVNVGSAQGAPPETVSKPVEITYAKSPYSDFLFYLFYRNTGMFPELKVAVPLEDIPVLDDSSFLPDDAAASAVTSYAELYRLAATYDDHLRLNDLLERGETHYGKFYPYWKEYIALREDETIRAWKRQEAKWSPVPHLEQIERLNFPFESIRIKVIAPDPKGSSMQGPPTIFTTAQVPSLAWVIGHEGTHMMLGPRGADWKMRKNGDEAVRLITTNGGGAYDVEEALCLLMQAKLSIAAGETPSDYLSSTELTQTGPRKTLLLAMERDWPAYVASSKDDIADFLIAETIKTFSER